jgi:hypothetical protein
MADGEGRHGEAPQSGPLLMHDSRRPGKRGPLESRGCSESAGGGAIPRSGKTFASLMRPARGLGAPDLPVSWIEYPQSREERGVWFNAGWIVRDQVLRPRNFAGISWKSAKAGAYRSMHWTNDRGRADRFHSCRARSCRLGSPGGPRPPQIVRSPALASPISIPAPTT